MRLDPMLNYLCDIAARVNRQTKSSFIEMAVKDAIARTPIQPQNPGVTVWAEAGQIWDVDEPDRFVKLAINYPELLTYEEQVLWKTLCSYDWYWDDTASRTLEKAHWVRIRGDWATLKQVAQGVSPETELEAFNPGELWHLLQEANEAALSGDDDKFQEAQNRLAEHLLNKTVKEEDDGKGV